MESSLATSSAKAAACPPAAAISAATSASFASLRAASATVAPAFASSSAHARPIPCDAPVTSAILPFKSAIDFHLRRRPEFNRIAPFQANYRQANTPVHSTLHLPFEPRHCFLLAHTI